MRSLAAVGLLMLALAIRAQSPVPATETAEQTTARKVIEALQFADGYYKREIYDRAARAYEGVVRDFPDSPQASGAWFFWGQSLALTGNADGAMDVFSRLAQTHPKTIYGAQAALTAAGLLTDRNRTAEAEPMLTAVDPTLLDPKQQEALSYFLALAQHAAGKTEAAEKVFTDLAARPTADGFPYRAHAKFHLASVRRTQGKDDDALRLFGELATATGISREMALSAAFQIGDILFVQQQYPRAAEAYRTYLKMDPPAKEAAAARVSLAWCLAQGENNREVVELLKDDDPAAMSADALYLLGNAQWRLRAFDTALTCFDRLATSFPDYRLAAQAQLLAIECNSELRNVDKVIELAAAFAKTYPQDSRTPDALFYLASALVEKGNKAGAAEALEEALRRFWGSWPYQNDAVIRLASIYEEMAHAVPDDASDSRKTLLKKAAETYRKFNGETSPSRQLEAISRAAQCEIQAKDSARAFADYQMIADKWPNETGAAAALLAMAQIADSKGSSEEVIRIAGRFLEKHRATNLVGQTLYLRGVAYYRLEKYPEAIADFRESLTAPPFDSQQLANLFLGYSLWSNDKRDEALQVFASQLDNTIINTNFTPDLLAEIADQYIANNNFDAAASCFQLLAGQERADYRALGEIGRARTALARGNIEAAIRMLVVTIKRISASEDDPYLPVARTYLGEAYRQRGSFDQARIELEEAIRVGTGDAHASALSRLAMAQVLYEAAKAPTAQGKEANKELVEKALDNAYYAFIVGNDKQASPEAMLLVARIHDEAGRTEEARKVGLELRKRYPVAFEDMRKRPENTALFRLF